MKYKAYVFDMDGTVLNTVEDLKLSLNYAMKENGHSNNFQDEQIRTFYGSGITVAITRALAYEQGASFDELVNVGTDKDTWSDKINHEEIMKIQNTFKPYYEVHCNDHTKPYDGILDLLQEIRKQGGICAVVSNKPNEAVQTLSKTYFQDFMDYSLGQQDTIRRKPFPDMLDACVKELGVDRKDMVYIGDSEIDIQTAQNGNMDCISVTWGFRTEKFLQENGATVIVHSTEEIQ